MANITIGFDLQTLDTLNRLAIAFAAASAQTPLLPDAAPAAIAAAPVAAPAAAPVATSAAMPTVTTPAYDLAGLMGLGQQLVHMEKMDEMVALVQRYGVVALDQLPEAQFASIAADMIAMGAKPIGG